MRQARPAPLQGTKRQFEDVKHPVGGAEVAYQCYSWCGYSYGNIRGWCSNVCVVLLVCVSNRECASCLLNFVQCIPHIACNLYTLIQKSIIC